MSAYKLTVHIDILETNPGLNRGQWYRFKFEVPHATMQELLGSPRRDGDYYYWHLVVDGHRMSIERVDPEKNLEDLRLSDPMAIMQEIVKVFGSNATLTMINFTRMMYTSFGDIALNDPNQPSCSDEEIIDRLGSDE